MSDQKTVLVAELIREWPLFTVMLALFILFVWGLIRLSGSTPGRERAINRKMDRYVDSLEANLDGLRREHDLLRKEYDHLASLLVAKGVLTNSSPRRHTDNARD